MRVEYLVDKSALARWHQHAVAVVLDAALAAGLLWTCPPVELEVLFSARTAGEYRSLRADRALAYQHAPLSADIGVIAVELQASLADAGTLRAVGAMDILIAATAVHRGLTVLHYDGDFEILARADDRVAERWVVPRGSVD